MQMTFGGYAVLPDPDWPAMYRVRRPDGSLTDMVNLTRAKDAAATLAEDANVRPASGATQRRNEVRCYNKNMEGVAESVGVV